MKPGINITGLLLLLSFLTVQLNAQQIEKTYNKKEKAIKKHNEYVYTHAKALEKAIVQSDDWFNKKSSLKHARKIKLHATKAKFCVNKLKKEENNEKKSESRFNRVIEHYDKILQEEFQVEKELGMPAADHHKLASHLSVILNELEEIKKKI